MLPRTILYTDLVLEVKEVNEQHSFPKYKLISIYPLFVANAEYNGENLHYLC